MIEGRYFPPSSSQAVPARLWSVSGEMRLMLQGEVAPRHPRLVSVSDRLGSIPRKFAFHDGGVFEAPADADVDGMMSSHGSFFSRLSRLEAHKGFVAGAVVLTLVLLVGLYRWGLPALATGAAIATPSALLSTMDAGVLQTVDRAFFKPSALAESEHERITAIFAELAAISGQKQPELELLFRDGGRLGANAFALPGGTIVITDQLIGKADNDDEIAGVLAHEIGHVQRRHSLQQIYRVLGLTFMIGVIGGDSSQIVDDVVGQAAALQSLAYTREFEADADRRSVEIMVKAGRDPLAFVRLLERVTAGVPGAKKTGWMSTHPGADDRRKAVGEYAEKLLGER